MCIICSLSQTFDPTRHNSDNPLSGSDTSSLTASEISGATDVEVGATASGVISSGGEQDVFAITLEAGETYSIAALGTGSSSGTLSDTDLHLYDSEGNFIEYDDFAGAGLDALITFTATSSGTYYIMVDSWSSSSSGSYQLQIDEAVALPPTGSEGTYEELSEFLQNEGQGAENEIKVSSSTITVNISGLTALGQQMAQWAMEAWEMVANVDFQIVTSGEMVTVDDSASGYAAWAFLGAQNNNNGIEMMVSESWFDFGTTLDSYTFQTYVHEFGHILGLNHLGPYNGSADFGVDNYFSNDSYQVSVMSYFSQTENPNVDASFAYLAGPMIADILAIQDFYGAPDENSVTGGDTVYGLNSNLGNYMDTLFDALATGATLNVIEGNRVAFTIYDQGGTDLIDLSFADSSTDVTLNLNEGVFSDYGTHIGAFNIAIGTVIENASTGAGDDTITGNDADNVLRGGSGADQLFGGAGDDKIYSGKGNDYADLGEGDDYVRVGGGVEEFHGGAGKDYISYYDSTDGVNINLATNEVSGSWAVNDTISGFESVSGSKTGDDKIHGTSGSNTIKTYGGDDRVYAGKGTDRVELGSGNDYVRVGGGKEYFDGGSGKDYISYYDSKGGIRIDLEADSVSGSWAVNDTIKNFESASGSKTGADTMLGTSGSNTLKSYGGNDKLYGRSGDDKLYGGDGEDRFDGGAGTDLLYGGADADTFHFDHGEDHDIIKDFENNVDVIQLDNFGFASKDEAFSFATQSGEDVVFDFGDGDMLTVENATIGQLQNDLEIV